VKAATGEVVSAEDLGGGDVHTRAVGRGRPPGRRTTRTRWRIARAHRRATSTARKPRRVATARAARAALTRPEELHGVVPADTRKPYDVREVIARIVDGSEFDEFKARLRHHAGHAASRTSHGMPVGIVANNGILFSRIGAEGRALHRAVLPARASRWCSCRTSPASWWAASTRTSGIAQHGAKMVTAVACAQRAQVHRDHRRQLRRRQLRHVRPRLFAALPVDVAERAHLA
jgi:3-methylcrotonyl-CoA carboxylase beta subunit